MTSLSPYERARRLEAQGRSLDEIREALKAEGVSDDDLAVVLGSLKAPGGEKPPLVPKPLATVSRVLDSRALLAVIFAGVALALAPLLYLAWSLWSGLREGR